MCLAARLRSAFLTLITDAFPVLGEELRSLRDYAAICDEMSRMLRRARKECMVTEGVVESLQVLLAELDELRAWKQFHSIPVGQYQARAPGGDA